MAENATQEGTSEVDSSAAGAAASGTAAEGSAAPTQAATDSGAAAFAAERARFENTIRTLQSERDSLRAAQQKATPDPAPAAASPAGLTLADLQRVEDLRETRDALKARFPGLPAETFKGYLSEESAEAFTARVEAEASARDAQKEALKAEVDAEVRALYAEKYGNIESLVPADTGKTAPEGQATVESLLAKPISQLDPEEVDRVLRAV